MSAYIAAFWQGHLTGPELWLAWAGLGLLSFAIAAAVVLGLIALADWSTRRWPGDLDCNDYCGSPRGDE